METINRTKAAEAASRLRKALKDKFPGTKFSVTSKNYSGGDSIRVSWTLGPTTEMVNQIAGNFQDGDFDGMTDMYNYREDRHEITPEGNFERIPRAKYVFCDREYILPDGQDLFQIAVSWVAEHYSFDHTTNPGYERDRIAHTILAASDLSKGFHGFRHAPEESSQPYEAY